MAAPADSETERLISAISREISRCRALLLLDGAKAVHPDVLGLVESRLRPGAFIVADNADFSPEHLTYVRSTANGYLSIAVGDDVELSMRTR